MRALFLVGNRNHRVCLRGGGRPFDVDRTMVGNMSPSDGREESDGKLFEVYIYSLKMIVIDG